MKYLRFRSRMRRIVGMVYGDGDAWEQGPGRVAKPVDIFTVSFFSDPGPEVCDIDEP